jgi:hypothetical protein
VFLDMERRLDTGVPLVFLKSLRENATGDVSGGWKEGCDAMRCEYSEIMFHQTSL